MTASCRNNIHDGIKSRLNSGNACYHSVTGARQEEVTPELISTIPKHREMSHSRPIRMRRRTRCGLESPRCGQAKGRAVANTVIDLQVP
jgi:hypothetical protein